MLSRTRPWRSPRAPLSFIDPSQPTVRDKLPAGPGWVYEVKHDGYRLQVHLREKRVRLFTRTGIDWTERFPRILDAVSGLSITSAIFDCEAVICDPDGVADFDALHSRARDDEVCAYAFDLLQLDGKDLRGRPLVERKRKLARTLRRACSGLVLSEHLTGDPETIFRHACDLGLEGIVAKRLGSKYKSGRTENWIKVKNPNVPAFLRVIEGTF